MKVMVFDPNDVVPEINADLFLMIIIIALLVLIWFLITIIFGYYIIYTKNDINKTLI